MSVTIRLAKIGKRHAPSYKVVVANTRDKRNGKFLDVLGYYNPTKKPEEFEINKDRYNEWKGKGALTTKAVEQLVAGEYVFVKYEPNKKEEASEEAGDTKAAEPQDDAETEEDTAPEAEETKEEETE